MTDRGEEHLLEKALERVGWGSRLDEYRRCFEYASRFNAVGAPAVSIVVISWRLHPDTARSFRILQTQREHNFELILVNNGAGEGKLDSLKPFTDLYVQLNANTGVCRGRNFGAAFARAPILLFLEDDGIPSPDFVEAHLDAFRKYVVISVRGVYKPKTGSHLNDRARHYYLGDKPFPIFADVEGNTSYAADAFYRAGGWDDRLYIGREGISLSLRLREFEPDMRKQIYSPAPVIFHDYAPDEAHLEKKLKWQERATALLRERYEDYDAYLESWWRYYGRDDLLITRLDCENDVY